MGWSGTILGAILGARLGSFAGPWGAVAGAVIGGAVEAIAERANDSPSPRNNRDASERISEEELVMEAWETLFCSYGRLAKSDGVVSREEADLVGEFLRQTGLPSAGRKRLIAAFNAGKQSGQTFRRMVTAVKNSFRDDAYTRIMGSYCDIVLADGVIDDVELAMLRDAEQVLGRHGFVDRWLKNVRGDSGKKHEAPPPEPDAVPDLDAAYRMLGLTPQCTDDEVKKAWRSKAKEYHPDVLRGKGVEESVIKLAEVQMRRFNDAYAQIRKARNL